jgi:class 3 adenylate cyclase
VLEAKNRVTIAAMERKVATVLFADLVDSTKLGEQDPERTRLLLDRFYEAMSEEVGRVGGTLEKFAGDAVMAAFGAPAALEDHAERALHSALAMRRRLHELFGGRIELRIGVNTGDVVVDTDAHSSFVTGDAVNVCARLEQHASPGEILVGERTATAARGAFEFGPPQRIEAKGKSEPVECRKLVRAVAATRPRGRFARPFVGRTRELGTLLDTYGRAIASGEPQLALVVGDAGVGKSRLVRELWAALEAQPEGPVLRVGRCLSYGSAITYWPVREIVQAHFDLPDDADSREVIRRLGDRAILGIALGLDVARDLHPLAARDRLRDAWLDLVEAAVAEHPLMLVIEDVHWAEAPLLELLERTVRDVRGPMLVVATSRPDATWTGGRGNVTTLELEPLARDAAQRLVSDLPESVRGFLLDRAEGNPFFVEELTESLVDRGVLSERHGRWEAVDLPDPIATPDSVRGVLAARIDLLPAREKAALQAASVIGRVFWEGPVRELIGGDADFALLEERDFIRRSAESRLQDEREHTIKHALTREAAYMGIPKAERARLHAAFAAWIEARRDRADELASLLAHHYAEAVRPEDVDLAWAGADEEVARLRAKAREWLQRAAERATQRYELNDALELLARAMPLATTREERLAVHRATARAHALNFAGQQFWEAMHAAIAETDDPQIQGELYAEIAFESALRSGIWQRMPRRETVDTWVDRALEHAPADSRARAMALIARARWDPIGGADDAIEASRIAEQLGDPALRSAAWDARGIVAFVSGEFDHGRAWAERRFELLDQITDPDVRADIHSAPISGCIWSGRFREARRLAQVHDEIVESLTPHHRLHGVAIKIEVEELLGRWDIVRALQARAELAVEENLETPCVRNPRVLLVAAVANELDGDAAAGRRLEERALELWMDGYGLTLDTPRLRLALARGDLDGVEQMLALPDTAHGWHRGWFVFANVAARFDALAALDRRNELEKETPRYLRRANYLRPFALRALGRVRRDPALLREALAEFEGFRLAHFAAETRALLDS